MLAIFPHQPRAMQAMEIISGRSLTVFDDLPHRRQQSTPCIICQLVLQCSQMGAEWPIALSRLLQQSGKVHRVRASQSVQGEMRKMRMAIQQLHQSSKFDIGQTSVIETIQFSALRFIEMTQCNVQTDIEW